MHIFNTAFFLEFQMAVSGCILCLKAFHDGKKQEHSSVIMPVKVVGTQQGFCTALWV